MFFWGSAFATSKMLVLEVPPEVGAVLRFGFGSLLMMAILFRRSARGRENAIQGARVARKPAISRSIPSTAVFSRKLP